MWISPILSISLFLQHFIIYHTTHNKGKIKNPLKEVVPPRGFLPTGRHGGGWLIPVYSMASSSSTPIWGVRWGFSYLWAICTPSTEGWRKSTFLKCSAELLGRFPKTTENLLVPSGILVKPIHLPYRIFPLFSALHTLRNLYGWKANGFSIVNSLLCFCVPLVLSSSLYTIGFSTTIG